MAYGAALAVPPALKVPEYPVAVYPEVEPSAE